MKRLYKTQDFIKFNKAKSLKHFRRRLTSKLKKRNLRISLINKSKIQIQEERIISDSNYNKLTPPRYFSFIERPKQVIEFVNKLENLYLNKQNVYVDLRNIEYLDYSAVAILVSVMFSFKARKIKFNGNFPNDIKLAQLLIDADFFKYLNEPVGKKIKYTLEKENQIFTQSNKEVNSELGLVVMAEASKSIWGEKRTCKGLQRTLLELMQNTNNHADVYSKGEKHWWLSVNHDKTQKKVSFIFIDYGVGIFESLKHKPQTNKWFGWYEKIKNMIIHGGNNEIFKLLLEGQMHLTVTGEHFRGKGLPGIKQVLDRNQISNLKIISNDVIADVSNGEYSKLDSEFSGTFVSWELNENNINSKWIL